MASRSSTCRRLRLSAVLLTALSVACGGSEPDAPAALEVRFLGPTSVDEGQRLDATVTSSAPAAATVAYSATGLPRGAVLGASTGSFSWTPDFDQAGTFTVVFTVASGSSSGSTSVLLTVANVNRAPLLSIVGPQLVAEERALEIWAVASDPDGSTPVVTVEGLPDGASFASGLLRWTPRAGQAGEHIVTFSATDGTLTASETVRITVIPLIEVRFEGPTAVAEGQRLDATITASSPGGAIARLSASGLPRGATFEAATGRFSWTPEFDQAGAYTLVFGAESDLSSGSTSVGLTVTDVNRAPVLSVVGTATVAERRTLEVWVVATDPDGTTPTVTVSGLPDGATYAFGLLSWTPRLGQAGGYTVTFNASDGLATDSENVQITVTPAVPDVAVPGVVGLTRAQAEAAIAAAGLTVGTVGTISSRTVPAGSVASQDPAAGTLVLDGTAVAILVSSGPAHVTVPDVVGLAASAAQGAITSAGLVLGTRTDVHSETVPAGRVIAQVPGAGSDVLEGTEVAITVSLGSADVPPPDPATVATTVDRTVATNLATSTAFLYSGDTPIQTGVQPGTIAVARAAVVRGRAITREGQPLAGVRITVLDHPELGRTLTRDDGMFDLAVNGGGRLTVSYEKPGYFPAQRQVEVPWQAFAAAPDVVLVQADTRVTSVDLNAATPMQVAQGNPVSDERGTRQASLLFSQGTSASMVLPDGSSRPLTALSVRATEYTVGTSGPQAMPATLPASSAYTYAVELSVDEAVAAGATDVRFSRPVYLYVDDFIGFPAGTAVPTGYYDRQRGAWVASANGRVLSIVGATAGLAEIDADGDGAADPTSALASLGIGDEERRTLATMYPVAPKRLWRSPVTHFSPWDCNWPFGPPADAVRPDPPRTRFGLPIDDPCFQKGSIIDCQNQVLGEEVPVAGTPYTLNYNSNRVPGSKRQYTLEIPVSGASLPPSLVHIVVEIEVAGRTSSTVLPPQPNQVHQLVWDGKDAYGRDVQGAQPVKATLSYGYVPVYYPVRSDLEAAFGRVQGSSGGAIGISGYRTQVIYLSATWEGLLGGWDARATGLGAWTLDRHHQYDPYSSVLYMGSGATRSAEDVTRVLGTSAGNGTYSQPSGRPPDGLPATKIPLRPEGIAIGPDGTMYVADDGYNRVLRIGPDGVVHTLAGNGGYGFSGDGGPAVNATMRGPGEVALGPAGDVYFVDTSNYAVRRVGTDGIISTVVGNGTSCTGGSTAVCGDGGPAALAQLAGYNRGLTVGPDGSVYVSEDRGNVRRVGPDGIVSTIAGGNGGCAYSSSCGDGGLAIHANVPGARGLAIGPDGSLYIADHGRVRRVYPDGIIRRFAGTGSGCSGAGTCGDGGPATQAQLTVATDVAVAVNGDVYISENNGNCIRKVDGKGIITTVGGSGNQGRTADQSSATEPIYLPDALALDPRGMLYFVEPPRVRRIAPALPGLSSGDIVVASSDGTELYVFHATGKHLRTVDALTGVTLETFGYTSDGLLASVTDRYGSVTTVERGANGIPVAIVAPLGQRTSLQVDAGGFLASIANPAGDTIRFVSTSGGLLTRLTEPRGDVHDFGYDDVGLLTSDTGPAGSKILARTEGTDGYTVRVTTQTGAATSYAVQRLSSGGMRRTSVDASGATTVAVLAPDGSSDVTYPDGTVQVVRLGPDPRWGMQAPLAKTRSLALPGQAAVSIALTRQVTLADPANPLSLIAQTDTETSNGRVSSTIYDAAARTITRTSPAGRQTVTALDAFGMVASVGLGAGTEPVVVARNATGQVVRVGQGSWWHQYAYDALGRASSRTDAGGNRTSWSHDLADRVIQATLPAGESYAFTYDADGNPTAIGLPGGDAYAMSYLGTGLADALSLPRAAGRYAWSHDADGASTGTTLPGGRVIGRTLDAGGRPTGQGYPEATASYLYADSTDRVTRLQWTPAGGTSQVLDIAYRGGLPTSSAWTGPAQGTFTYAYDANLFLSSMGLTSGVDAVSIAITRDADGLVTGYGPYTFSRGAADGRVSAATDGTLTVGYAYDAVSDLAIRSHAVLARERFRLELGYDASGRISSRTETLDGTQRTQYLLYDPDGQLVEVRQGGVAIEAYAYDAKGNRLQASRSGGPAEEATYDFLDRLVQRGSLGYAYDLDGYLSTRGTDSFGYSARGELLWAQVAGGAVTYGYDAVGRRTSRTDASGTVGYLYGNPGDAMQVTAVREASGALAVLYYDQLGHLIGYSRDGSRYAVATDQVGSPRAVIDATGQLVRTIEYDAFGVVTFDSNPSFFLPLGFGGGLADPATGLVRFGLRDYEPASGRWTSRDPALFAGGRNLYAYLGSDPVNSTDPAGLFSVAVNGYSPQGGGGAKVTVTAKGMTICLEVGLGKGGSAKVDPFDNDLGRPGITTAIGAELTLKWGPGSIKVGAQLDDRGCPKVTSPEVSVGPFSTKGNNLAVKGKPEKFGKNVVDLFKGTDVKMEGKISGQICHTVLW